MCIRDRYINRFYYSFFVYPTINFSRWALRNIETRGIDRFNYVIAQAASGAANRFRRTHTGILNYNMVAMILGLTVLLILLSRIAMGG